MDGGHVGVLANGAGYAMATQDLLHVYGGKAANFFDLDGDAFREKITHALIIMEKHKHIDSIFVNMYCGQLPADKVANVIRDSYREKLVSKPMVCRIKGTNADIANTTLQNLKSHRIVCI